MTAETPLLSVIVPVHGVEEYLPDCLDSVLPGTGAGARDDLEVVAVDDRSPDSSGAILDAYAARDPRVRVTHLTSNVGLGQARNIGLEQARGEYVWFVDSDDWLPADSVPVLRQRLEATRPDVLVIDHVVVDPAGAGHTQPWPAGVGSAPPGPLAQRPELLRLPLSTSACTKVVRRRLLEETGLRFPPGWYEDVAYAYPLLLAAGRIDALDRVCYCYRRREGGAITRSASSRHFDIFAQYERMWAGVGQASGPLRSEMFRLMIDHLLVVAGNERRLPAPQRRDFFRRVADAYRRYLPAGGYPVPGGAAGLRHRLVRRNAYTAYALLRWVWRIPARLRRSDRPAAVPPASAARPTFAWSPGRQVGPGRR